MGMKVASVALLCQDTRVFKAMEMAGTPCPYMGATSKKATAAWAKNQKDRPDAESKKAEFLEICTHERTIEGKNKGKWKSKQTCKKEWRKS
jgi:DMSO/TMAO reductase YedYZ molybdopterin-dependent catalytic subunit